MAPDELEGHGHFIGVGPLAVRWNHFPLGLLLHRCPRCEHWAVVPQGGYPLLRWRNERASTGRNVLLAEDAARKPSCRNSWADWDSCIWDANGKLLVLFW